MPACRTSPDPLRCFSRNLRESTPFTFQNCLARVRLIAFGTPCDTCAGIHRICRLKKENAAESNTDSSRMQPAVRDWQFRSTLAGFNLALRIPLHATIDSIQMGTVAPTRPHLIVQNDPTKIQSEDNAQRAQSFHLLRARDAAKSCLELGSRDPMRHMRRHSSDLSTEKRKCSGIQHRF